TLSLSHRMGEGRLAAPKSDEGGGEGPFLRPNPGPKARARAKRGALRISDNSFYLSASIFLPLSFLSVHSSANLSLFVRQSTPRQLPEPTFSAIWFLIWRV